MYTSNRSDNGNVELLTSCTDSPANANGDQKQECIEWYWCIVNDTTRTQSFMDLSFVTVTATNKAGNATAMWNATHIPGIGKNYVMIAFYRTLHCLSKKRVHLHYQIDIPTNWKSLEDGW